MEFVIALTVLVVFAVLVIRNAVVTSRSERRDQRRNRAATTGELVRLELAEPVHVPPQRANADIGQRVAPN